MIKINYEEALVKNIKNEVFELIFRAYCSTSEIKGYTKLAAIPKKQRKKKN